MRCTGKQPCWNCTGAGLQTECLYTAKYTRGKVPPIQAATREDYLPAKSWRAGLPADRRRSSPGHVSNSDSSDAEESSRSNQAATRNQTKEPSNFASVYRRAEHDMSHTATSKHRNPIYAFGDPALHDTESPLFILPPLEEGKGLLRKFFEVVAPGVRVLHQPSCYEWLLDMYQDFAQGRVTDRARSAIVLLLFANAYTYRDPASEAEDNKIRQVHSSHLYYT